MKMRRLATTLLIPMALGGLTACGESTTESITLEEATYLSALQEEDLNSNEREAPEAQEARDSGEDLQEHQERSHSPFACSFDQIRDRVRDRFDQDGDGEIGPAELEEMSRHFDDEEEADEPTEGEIDRPRRDQRAHRQRAEGQRNRGPRARGQQSRDEAPQAQDQQSGGEEPQAQGNRGDRPGQRRHRHHKLKRLRWIYDADSSGSLDAEERATLRADLNARCANIRARLLELFDADSSGTLEQEEREAARDARRDRRHQRRENRRDQADTNEDGHVSREERQAARAAHRENRQDRRATLKARFDADSDGVLSDEEKAALRDYLREWVRGEHLGERRPGADSAD